MQFERQIGSGAPDQAIEENAPPSIQINPYSELGRELRKWEQFPSAYGPAGNPYVFRAYPKMLYRAQRRPNGQFACMLPAPTPYDFANAGEYERAVLLKDTFDKSCTCIVGDESEERIRSGQGWSDSIPSALALAEEEQRAIGQAAAEAAYQAQRMSDKAKAEYVNAEAQTAAHVVDVAPVQKKRGRAPKGVKPVTE
jgi:hypothetical protein